MAKSWAKSKGAKLLPSGAYVAYLLGLIPQLSAKIEFITDGQPKTFESGHLIVSVKTASIQKLANADRISGLVFQAFKYLGEERVIQEILNQLKISFTLQQKQEISNDRKYAPKWLHKLISDICEISRL